jgi:hypothetical protein
LWLKSVIFVEKTGVLGTNTDLLQSTDKYISYSCIEYSLERAGIESTNLVTLRESINNETLTISSHNYSQEYERRTMDSNISVIFGTDFHVHLNTSVV